MMSRHEHRALQRPLTSVTRFVGALAAIGAAFCLRQGIVRLVGADLPPYITFYPTIMLIALAAGFWPGLLATITAALVASYFYLPPYGEFLVATTANTIGLSLFTGMGMLISLVAELNRRSRQEQEVVASATATTPSSASREWLPMSAGFVLALAILTAVGWLTLRNLTIQAEADRLTVHTYLVIQKLETLVSDLKDLESGERGYAITGDEKYLEPLANAKREVTADHAELQRLTKDNRNQQRRLEEIGFLIQRRVAETERRIRLRKEKSLAAAPMFMTNSTGTSLMGQIHRLITEAQSEEEQLLKQRLDEEDRNRNSTLRGLLAGNVISFVILASIFFLLSQENRRRKRVEGELRQERDRLEETVAERTAGLSREVEERRQAEMALRQSEERLGLFIKYAPAALAMLDSDMRYLSASQRWMTDYGLGDRNVRGLSHYDVFPEITEAWKAIHQRALEGEVIRSDHDRFVRSDGSVQWLQWEVRPWYSAAGKVGGILIFSEDITERKLAEEALHKVHIELAIQMEERIRELQEKEVLLKEVHHRVKNNLQVISSLVGLQANESRDNTVREGLQEVVYRVRSMALVHEKLYQSADLANIDFAEYVRSLLQYLWRAHGKTDAAVRLQFDLAPVTLPVDTAVPCGLILNELASNTLKHAFRGCTEGDVTVTLRDGGDGQVVMGIRDNGVGLPPGLDWRQANSLGLRLVQMLVKQLQAEITVGTGTGTSFEIAFSTGVAKQGKTMNA